jgi:hypothetical protein
MKPRFEVNDAQIDSLAERAVILARLKYIAPQTFLGVGA